MAYDGPRVFLAPCGNDAAQANLERTVVDGVPPEELAPHTDHRFESGVARLWGTKGSIASKWKSIEEGDFLLFYWDGAYHYGAEVTATERNEPLGRAIWPNHEEGKPWECIIFLAEPVALDIDSSLIHGLAGYDIHYPMGFSPLNEMGIGGIVGRFGSVREMVYGEGETDPEETTTIDILSSPSVDLDPDSYDDLYFPGTQLNDIVDQVNSALDAGKHVIFTGPPGTGKTEIARRTCELLNESNPNVYDGFEMTTATADWSTFETVGGYMPEADGGEALSFEPGQVLRRFKRDGVQHNELLVVDEINRADIDKSFGQLFTLLSGQAVQLPYKVEGEEVEVRPASNTRSGGSPHEFVMPNSWRILATMNSYDKTSLYEMSYAFMRRFAFVHVDAPNVAADESRAADLVRAYADTWSVEANEGVLRAVGSVWFAANHAIEDRKIGPAIVKDILEHVTRSPGAVERSLTQAVANYIFPQLEGVPRRDRVVAELLNVTHIETDRLERLSRDILGVEVDGQGRTAR